MKVQNVVKKYNETSLILRIVIGLIIGVILGLLIPGIPVFSIFGDVFVNSLKAIAPILVFVLVIASLAGGTGRDCRGHCQLYVSCDGEAGGHCRYLLGSDRNTTGAGASDHFHGEQPR